MSVIVMAETLPCRRAGNQSQVGDEFRLAPLTLPGGGGRRAWNARRGGVKVSPRERCPSWRLSPHPVSHLAMLADPPPPGEGKSRFNLHHAVDAAVLGCDSACFGLSGPADRGIDIGPGRLIRGELPPEPGDEFG